jgi:hypothetical protein
MFETLRDPVAIPSLTPATDLCRHSRLIDDVLTPQGLKSVKVRCLECGALFDDPPSMQRSGVSILNGAL